MFAVPGWSVKADGLKAETASASAGAKSASKSSTKKRKRAVGDAPDEVTTSNVADLFESVVEGKKPSKSQPQENSKRQKKDKQQEGQKGKKGDVKFTDSKTAESKKDGKAKNDDEKADEPATSATKKDKKSKKDKKKQKKETADATSDSKDSGSKAVAKAPPPMPPAPPKLTPLQAAMRQKLISARFRHLNETLYTRPSKEAYSLFDDSPEMFDEYHEGFRQQVKVWPENPVDSFLKDIRRRGAIKSMKGNTNPDVLARTMGTCTIADLGCGDARLAEELQADKKKLRLEVNSYDLQSPSPLVTKADIANLPLADGSVNVAIFCLALMGTNWVDFIEEAFRILHWKGELWVAEIKSRFGPVRSKNAPVGHSVGNRRKSGKQGGKGNGHDEGAFEDDLAVEVDGGDDRRKATDVSAFVEVLRKRGFVLKGEPSEAIDMSNKMFVKMHFIKGASPTKGKHVKQQEQGRGPKRGMQKWDLNKETEDEMEGREASVLKPCVYKIR